MSYNYKNPNLVPHCACVLTATLSNTYLYVAAYILTTQVEPRRRLPTRRPQLEAARFKKGSESAAWEKSAAMGLYIDNQLCTPYFGGTAFFFRLLLLVHIHILKYVLL
jgi:hypothetical protein